MKADRIEKGVDCGEKASDHQRMKPILPDVGGVNDCWRETMHDQRLGE
jgi:hypothetical protein